MNIGKISIITRNYFENLIYDYTWILGYSFDKNDKFPSLNNIRLINPPENLIYADPFFVKREGKIYVYFEIMSKTEKKGKIACLYITKDGKLSNPKIILEKKYHISYPYLFYYNNELYMIPETGENNSIQLYKCIEFPLNWKFEKYLLEGFNAKDNTLLFFNNMLWLFTNIQEPNSKHEKLYLFYANGLYDTFISHPLNPVKINKSSARPAGNIYHSNGNIFRPSQNCLKRYGKSIIINKVIDCSYNNYLEKSYSHIFPPENINIATYGIHTINFDHNFTIFDLLIRKNKYV